MNKKGQASEYDHQCALIEWCAIHSNHVPQFDLLFPSLNGIRVSIGVAVKMKKLGMKKSEPDLFWSCARWGYHGFYLELKRPGEKPRSDQVDMLLRLRAEGYKAEYYDSWWDAARALLDYIGYGDLADEWIGDPAQYIKQPRKGTSAPRRATKGLQSVSE